MIEQYKIIYGDLETIYIGEISEKKSKFIASIKKVETEEQAVLFINQMKKKYYDATHNCSAFIVGKNREIVRSSDDGEPSGTAGKPMLEVLLGSGIVNVVAVVTRYFGGTLLGTGGLVRAYTDATKAGLSECQTAIMCLGKKAEIHTDYNTVGKVLYELGQQNIPQDDSVYGENVVITVTVPVNDFLDFEKSIIEISSGKSKVLDCGEVYFEQLER